AARGRECAGRGERAGDRRADWTQRTRAAHGDQARPAVDPRSAVGARLARRRLSTRAAGGLARAVADPIAAAVARKSWPQQTGTRGAGAAAVANVGRLR